MVEITVKEIDWLKQTKFGIDLFEGKKLGIVYHIGKNQDKDGWSVVRDRNFVLSSNAESLEAAKKLSQDDLLVLVMGEIVMENAPSSKSEDGAFSAPIA